MDEMVKKAFAGVDVLEPEVVEGHYDLIGISDEIILPSGWERVVQPGWTIRMTMWPIPGRSANTPSSTGLHPRASGLDEFSRSRRASKLKPAWDRGSNASRLGALERQGKGEQ